MTSRSTIHSGTAAHGPLRGKHRAGVTLLELMLALALTTVILGLVAMTINVYLRMLDARRTDVEEAQIARAVLQRMAVDLRSAVQAEPLDMSALEQLLASDGSGGGGGRGAGTGAGGEAAGDAAGGELDEGTQTGTSESGTQSGTDSNEQAQSLASSSVAMDQLGLYGTQYELQVDISRLPRVEEFQQILSAEDVMGISDIPSDIKTVAYYLQGANSMSGASGGLPSDLGRPGLVRRELDRRVTMYATNNGTVEPLLRQGELMAPEVVALEFAYFDGLQWLTQWDSQLQGGLPLAVQITLGVAPDDQPVVAGPLNTLSDETLDQMMVYQLTVHLPAAQPPSTTGSTGATTGTSTGTGTAL